MRKYLKHYPYLLISLGLLVFLVVMIILSINSFTPLDIDIIVRDFFYNNRGEKGGACYYFFRIITEAGYVYAIIGIIILSFILCKGDRRVLIIGLGSLVVWLANTIIKAPIDRIRPLEELRWMSESSSSFPSGHSMTSTFLYLTLIYYVLSTKRSLKFKVSLTTIFSIVLVLIMISRMVLGVHYITDIIGGFSLGVLFVGLGILLDRFLNKRNFIFLNALFNKNK